MRILLTGASGFLGSHMLRHLLTHTDAQIVCPVSFSHRGVPERITLAWEGIPQAQERTEVVRVDLSCPIADTTAAQFGQPDVIVNYAAQSHVDRSIVEPVPFVRNNVELQLHLLQYARTVPNLTVFLQISTDEVYGPAPAGLRHVEWSPIIPSNPYSSSKACAEALCTAWWRSYGLPIVIVGSMNLLGETQDPEKFVPSIMRALVNNEPVKVHTLGGVIGSRHYLHARNLADGVLWLLQNQPSAAWPDADRPDRWHIAGTNEVNNLQMAELVASAAGMSNELKVELVESHRPGHDLRYALDTAKINQAGWVAPVDLGESLERTVWWTMQRPQWLHRTL